MFRIFLHNLQFRLFLTANLHYRQIDNLLKTFDKKGHFYRDNFLPKLLTQNVPLISFPQHLLTHKNDVHHYIPMNLFHFPI